MRTILPWKNGDADMAKWPKRVKHRNKVLAKVYRPCRGRNSYRVTWYASETRQMKYFPTYAGKGGAKEFSEALVKELANNSQAVMLTPAQASDALAAIERLATFYQTTGRKVSRLAPRFFHGDVFSLRRRYQGICDSPESRPAGWSLLAGHPRKCVEPAFDLSRQCFPFRCAQTARVKTMAVV